MTTLAGCGGGGSGGGGAQTPVKTTPTVTAWPTASAITYGQALASSTLTGGTASTAGAFAWTTPSTVPQVGTDSEGVTFTPTDAADYNALAGSVQVVVTPPAGTITNVSLVCTSTSITNVQTTSCTPTVTGVAPFTNTVNLALAPASAGTLSASQNIASGTPVVFTPTFNTGAQTPTATACSTMAGYTNVCNSVQLTVTLRTITLNAPTGNIWLPNCAGIVLFDTAQMGMVSGDTIHADPYPSATYTSTPPSILPISMGIGNDPGVAGACSPGGYHEYATGTDGARSNDQYIPILSPWNMWAGYNSTDEFQADFAGNATCKYKLTDGTPDGACLPVVGLITIVDGNNLITGGLGNGGANINNATTGAFTNGIDNSGGTIVDIAAKNGIVGYTTTDQEASFSIEEFNSANLANVQNVGTAPATIVGSTGCNPNSNAASFFSYDQAGSTLYRSDAIGNASTGTVTASLVDSVSLSGFSPASGLPTNLARYVVAWDSSCKAAVLAPVLTGGNNRTALRHTRWSSPSST